MNYSAKVLKGNQEGRTIGFPTINLSPTIITEQLKAGVYSSEVIYKEKSYLGALYYGPRLVKNETNIVLEIHILNFNETIYGEKVRFEIGTFIRGVLDFSSFEDLEKQIKSDIQKIRDLSHTIT